MEKQLLSYMMELNAYTCSIPLVQSCGILFCAAGASSLQLTVLSII
jgi:hypothetical protein